MPTLKVNPAVLAVVDKALSLISDPEKPTTPAEMLKDPAVALFAEVLVRISVENAEALAEDLEQEIKLVEDEESS